MEFVECVQFCTVCRIYRNKVDLRLHEFGDLKEPASLGSLYFSHGMILFSGGGTGFIGSRLSKCLQNKAHEVVPISRSSGKGKITWVCKHVYISAKHDVLSVVGNRVLRLSFLHFIFSLHRLMLKKLAFQKSVMLLSTSLVKIS